MFSGVLSQNFRGSLIALMLGVCMWPCPAAQPTQDSQVQVRGVVCFYDAHSGELFLQHEDYGVRVQTPTKIDFELGLGQLIQAEGWMNGGSGSWMLKAERILLLGEGPLPDPLSPPFARMASGGVG